MSGKKVCIVSDLHYGSENRSEGYKLNKPSEALDGFRKLVEEKDYDKLILLGDQITAEDSDLDRKRIGAVDEVAGDEAFVVVGNHDIRNLDKDVVNSLTGREENNFSEIIDGYKFIFLDTVHEGYSVRLRDSEVGWLRQELENIGRSPVFVFSHAPLYSYSLDKTRWGIENQDKAYIDNYREVVDILKGVDHQVICISGHIHQNKVRVEDNITFVNLQSFSENISEIDCGKPSQTHALLNLGEEIVMDICEMRTTHRVEVSVNE